jgi:ketol-acid reductoisomerase
VTTIFHDDDADLAPLAGASVAVIGYGNQGRSWALNLRDSGFDVAVCVRADASRDQAVADGFDAGDLSDASTADVVCVLVPDDVIPSLPLGRPDDGLTIVASGYTLAFDRFDPTGDVGMVAPRMLGPEVRRCYEEGIGFITAVGVHRDATGRARERTLAVAKAIGGLRQGAVELTPMQEAVLDLAVEQALSPALTSVHTTFVQVMLEQGIPLEAVLTELILSGEVERTMRLVRESGYAAQFGFHSPTSQYGQLTRRGAYDHLDLATTMRRLVDDIASGRFADEWDAERDAGYPQLTALREQHAGPAVEEFETALRRELGEGAPASRPLLRSLFERCRVELPGDSRRSLDRRGCRRGRGPCRCSRRALRCSLRGLRCSLRGLGCSGRDRSSRAIVRVARVLGVAGTVVFAAGSPHLGSGVTVRMHVAVGIGVGGRRRRSDRDPTHRRGQCARCDEAHEEPSDSPSIAGHVLTSWCCVWPEAGFAVASRRPGDHLQPAVPRLPRHLVP